MRVYKLEKETIGSGAFIVSFMSDITGEIENGEDGTVWKITCDEMDEEEFMNLPEFEGF